MKRMMLAAFAGIGLLAGSALAQRSEVFDFAEEVKKGEQRAGFTLKEMIKTPAYTVGAIAVKKEIKTHRHKDGSHVIYIVSGRGTATLDGKPIALNPGTVVHIPMGSPYSINAEDGEMMILDFAHPQFDPAQMEWIERS
jgi:quercetin dioxygenase-like cupin family protein